MSPFLPGRKTTLPLTRLQNTTMKYLIRSGSLATTPEVLLLVLYCAVFGFLLVSTGGLPYVLDNNESFSSLWHARNIFEFGIGRSMGLADETFAYHSAAHPYVHTHQGNFPRLFALLIYALGARTIESQIAVTTFTVGVASILFAYRFFTKISNPLLAFITAALLITDYVLVAQWQVVTYRVWHMFFIFSTLLCVHGVGGPHRKRWLALTFVNYVCLFYFEFVYVAYVALFGGLYTAWLYRREKRTLLFAWSAQVGGAMLALSILTVQLILYMGWDDFLRDAYLTFIARNQYQNASAVLEQAAALSEKHHIAFWYNLSDGSAFRRIEYFAVSLLYYEFQIHTPFLCMIAAVLVGAYLVRHWMQLRSRNWNSSVGARRAALGALFKFPLVVCIGVLSLHLLWVSSKGYAGTTEFVTAMVACGVLAVALMWTVAVKRAHADDGTRTSLTVHDRIVASLGPLILLIGLPSLFFQYTHHETGPRFSVLVAAYLALFGSLVAMLLIPRRKSVRSTLVRRDDKDVGQAFFLYAALLTLLLACFNDRLYLGMQPEWPLFRVSTLLWLILCATGLHIVVVNLVGRSGHQRGFRIIPTADESRRIKPFSLFIAVASAFVGLAWLLFYQKYDPLWQEIASRSLIPMALLQTICLITILLGAVMVAWPGVNCETIDELPAFRSIVAFLAIGFVAYAIVYYLSPGYIWTGYRFRLAPFSVFHTQLLLAIAFYVLVRCVQVFWRYSGNREAAANGQGFWRIIRTPGRVGAKVACGLAAAVLCTLIAYWIAMQVTYMRLLPPNHFSVWKSLRERPYKGASFVTSMYAAPVAEYTGQWAYYDEGLADGLILFGQGASRLVSDDKYLWFADKKENPAYAKPQYFMCLISQSLPDVLTRLQKQQDSSSDEAGCSAQELVKLAKEGTDIYPRMELVAIDTEGKQRSGIDSWAIIKFHWEDQPFVRARDQGVGP